MITSRSWGGEVSPFTRGEKLSYIVKWGLVTAGYAQMTVEPQEWNQKQVYRITTEAHTTRFMDAFYKVRDTTESIVQRRGFCSLQFIKDLNEGRHHKKQLVVFDQDRRKAIYPDETVEIAEGTIDVLASLYYVRMQNLVPGKEFVIPTCDNKKKYELTVVVIGKETVKVPAGEFKTIVVEPRLKHEGIFLHKGRLFVYLTDDKERVPVLLRSKIAVGSITAELERVQRGSD